MYINLIHINLIPILKKGWRGGYLLCLVYFLFLFVSCLDESGNEACLSYGAILDVADKNYTNIGTVTLLEPKDELLPFRQYVGNILYRLSCVVTLEPMFVSSYFTVEGNDQTYHVDFPSLPGKRYILDVIGNSNESWVNGTVAMHPGMQEYTDIYVAYDTVEFMEGVGDKLVDMHRVKGGLVILYDHMPDSLARIDQQVDSIYQYVDGRLNYTGETAVKKSFTKGAEASLLCQMLLAPTVTGKKSAVQLSLFVNGKDIPYLVVSDIHLRINRNEITYLIIDFKLNGGLAMWTMIDGTWVMIHDMDIVTE